MILNLFKRFNYFAIIELDSLNPEEGKNLSPEVINFIKRYFFWRGCSINYFEPMTSPCSFKTFIVIGTAKQEKNMNRNVLIFLLELYAHIKDPNIEISQDFPFKVLQVNGEKLKIYKIKK
jgi:hypothetical protein